MSVIKEYALPAKLTVGPIPIYAHKRSKHKSMIVSFIICLVRQTVRQITKRKKRIRNMKTNKQQAILFIIFSILFFLITDSTFYTAYKERNTKTLFVKYIVADSPN